MIALQPPAPKKTSRRRVALWAAFFVGLTAAALMGWRMSHVPADLDLATRRMAQGGRFEVAYEPGGSSVPLNELHSWTLGVTTPDGRPVEEARITVDGDMPQHGHGLPTRPEVTQLGGGRYLVEGMRFQMGGWWVVDVTITAEGVTDQVRFNLRLE